MSSGFVSGGTTDTPIARGDEWLAAQQEIEANRQRKAEESRQADGKSLYETLQANKAAKQEAFEESIRLKNQFRALDEDEVEFLDSVLESTRAEEERVRRETAEGLEAFRRQQEEADKRLLANAVGAAVLNSAEDQEEWAAGGAKKRKRRGGEKEVLVKGVKLRKSSTSGSAGTTSAVEEPPSSAESEGGANRNASPAAVRLVPMVDETSCARNRIPEPISSSSSPIIKVSTTTAHKSGLCLVDYGSDEDED